MKYKVNLHILEACNYQCKHCFAHFDSTRVLSLNEWKQIVDNVPLYLVDTINIAGGEPLLYKDLDALIDYIVKKGFKCSIITNGSRLTPKFIQTTVKKLDMIGFSIDSFERAAQIGRLDKGTGLVLTYKRFKEILNGIKRTNPSCKIKVNTVVNKINKNEYLNLKGLPIDKWKILKMEVFETENFSNKYLSVSNTEYEQYVSANRGQVIEEVYESSLKSSYIMVDSRGILVDNSHGYIDVQDMRVNPLTEESLRFLDKKLYESRYKSKNKVGNFMIFRDYESIMAYNKGNKQSPKITIQAISKDGVSFLYNGNNISMTLKMFESGVYEKKYYVSNLNKIKPYIKEDTEIRPLIDTFSQDYKVVPLRYFSGQYLVHYINGINKELWRKVVISKRNDVYTIKYRENKVDKSIDLTLDEVIFKMVTHEIYIENVEVLYE